MSEHIEIDLPVILPQTPEELEQEIIEVENELLLPMAADDKRETELILSPGTFAFLSDETKGKINTLSGPIKISLSNTDKPVVWDAQRKRFIPATSLQQAIQTNCTVAKGQYLILENPASDGKQPEPGKLEDLAQNLLKMGQIENISGPKSFPLWPGQNAKVIPGHHLRTNQYLLVRVYDDEAAKANWEKSVVKASTADDTKTDKTDKKTEKTEVKKTTNTGLDVNKDTLITGQLLIIKGTEIGFYIPPTGIEVVQDNESNYVRDAVTLERLEYSILLDENGNKEYRRGPDMVFPAPTQTFVVIGSKRKHRAYELQPTTGIHLKVIADYEEDNKKFKAGQELFLTGADTPIYYPRPEHSQITYGGGDKHFATAIPAGEGRHVLDRQKGSVDLVVGPNMFLANPISQVMVRRILSDAECSLYYPGNTDVLEVNRALRDEAKQSRTKSGIPILPTEENLAGGGSPNLTVSYASMDQSRSPALESAGSPKMADTMQRSQKYTAPRTIMLDSKYQGAVRVEVYSGYAIQVVNSAGNRRTIVGPQAVLLEYDEKLQRLSLSKGKPKNSDTRIDTVYLKHVSNPVSDTLRLKTHDLVELELSVKYLIRFDDDKQDKWFNVDNYVQHACDHLRSLVGNETRKLGVQEFYGKAADIVRDLVLGAKDDKGNRPFRHFAENGMTIYDLELIDITINDEEIEELMSTSRQQALTESIELERLQQNLSTTKATEIARRQILIEQDTTKQLQDGLVLSAHQRAAEVELHKVSSLAALEIARQEGEQTKEGIVSQIHTSRREAKSLDNQVTAVAAEQDNERRIKLINTEAQSTKVRMESVAPQLTAALVAAASTDILKNVVPQMGALAFVNHSDLETTLNSMVQGTAAEGILQNLKDMRTTVSSKK